MDQRLSSLNITLMRILTEIRYDRSFLFEDLKMLNQISKGLKGYFGQSQKDEPNNALLFINPEKQLISAVKADTTSIDMQKPLYKDFESISTKVMKEVSKSLDIEEYTRLGMRLFFGKVIPSVEDGQKLLSEKFFGNFDKELNASIQNPQLTFTFQKTDNYFVNTTLRVESNATFEITPAGVNHTQNSFIVIDLDVYTNVSESYERFIEQSKEIGIKTLNQILKVLEV
jgi:hypothetical protein